MDFEIRDCPYCGASCEADWVDVGPGWWVQCGPFHCQVCKASEIGPHDKKRPLSAIEKETGWYAPGAEPGSSANVIGGQIVTAAAMREAYDTEFRGNPLHGLTGRVEQWHETVRKDGLLAASTCLTGETR